MLEIRELRGRLRQSTKAKQVVMLSVSEREPWSCALKIDLINITQFGMLYVQHQCGFHYASSGTEAGVTSLTRWRWRRVLTGTSEKGEKMPFWAHRERPQMM